MFPLHVAPNCESGTASGSDETTLSYLSLNFRLHALDESPGDTKRKE